VSSYFILVFGSGTNKILCIKKDVDVSIFHIY
jgi:hypothetical protein